jgi:hypothetical protein
MSTSIPGLFSQANAQAALLASAVDQVNKLNADRLSQYTNYDLPTYLKACNDLGRLVTPVLVPPNAYVVDGSGGYHLSDTPLAVAPTWTPPANALPTDVNAFAALGNKVSPLDTHIKLIEDAIVYMNSSLNDLKQSVGAIKAKLGI